MVSIFEQGDIVYMDFDPQAGHEQRGRRPADDIRYIIKSAKISPSPRPSPRATKKAVHFWTAFSRRKNN